MNRRKARNLALFAAAVVVLIVGTRLWDMRALARLTPVVRAAASGPDAEALARHVRILAGRIGERNYAHPGALTGAERYIRGFLALNGYKDAPQEYKVRPPGMSAEVAMKNFIATVPAAAADAPVLVIGAHYDTAPGTPGADDNASGVAVLLELARRFKDKRGGAVELRFVAYGSEEPPFFGTVQMGSAFHAKALKAEGRAVLGMASLEMLGYYDDRPGTQTYPPPLSLFYPSRANYVGLVANLDSRAFLKRFAAAFDSKSTPKIVAALPGWVGEIKLSDHLSYWNEGFPAILVTDTSFLRYSHYHMSTDTPDRLDYARMADVTGGLEAAIESLRAGN